MPSFTLHRNFILRTTHGHSVEFQKGKPTHVPPVCVNDAIAIGAVPVDGMDSLDEQETTKVVLTPEQRKAAVFKAFDTMETRLDRADYTASGVPNAKRLPALTGFEITTSERDAYWVEYKALAQEAKDQDNLDARLSVG